METAVEKALREFRASNGWNAPEDGSGIANQFFRAGYEAAHPWLSPLASNPATAHVLDEVYAERLRQEKLREAGKFLWTCAAPEILNVSKLAVLAEEFGEAAKEVTDGIIATDKWKASGEVGIIDPEIVRRLRTELIQVAAVAVAWAESIRAPSSPSDGREE